MSKATADLAMGVLSEVDCAKLWESNYCALMSEGKLSGDKSDIDVIVRKTIGDYREFNEDAVKETLFAHVWPSIKAVLVTGLARWYDDKLRAELQADIDLGENGA